MGKSLRRFHASRLLTSAVLPSLFLAPCFLVQVGPSWARVDATPSVSITDANELEGNEGQTAFEFFVLLSKPSSEVVTVEVHTADGTAAVANDDYVAVSGVVTIPAQTMLTTVTVFVNGDPVRESDETFSVTLSNPSGAMLGDSTGTGVIENDDPQPFLYIDDVMDNEGNVGKTPFVFRVLLSNPIDTPATVDWATADGTATAAPNSSPPYGNDYQPNSTTLTIPPKSTQADILVFVNGDLDLEEGSGEPDFFETFYVQLSNPVGASLADDLGEGRIVDDEKRCVPGYPNPFCPGAELHLISPNGGEMLVVGTPTKISWTASFVDSLSLSVSRDLGATWEPIVVGLAPETRSVTWQVPPPGNNTDPNPVFASVMKIRAFAGLTGTWIEDVSDAPFAIYDFASLGISNEPTPFALSAPFPNPAAGATRVDFMVAQQARVKLTLLDPQGREIAVLADGVYPRGRHQVAWHGRIGQRAAPVGIYFLRYETPAGSFVRRLALAR